MLKELLGPPVPLRALCSLFFSHLYSLFPVRFIRYIREQGESDHVFSQRVRPLVSSLKLTPLITSSEKDEMDPSRWANKEPYQIVTDCVIDNLVDPSKKVEDWIRGESESLKLLSKQGLSAATL